MKKLVVCLLVVLATCFTVNATDLVFGVKAGLVLDNIDWESTPSPFIGSDHFKQIAFTGGVMMEMPMGPILLGAEVLYTQKGETFTDGITKQRLKMDYIEMPVMAKYEFAKKIFIYGGMNLGMLLSAEMVYRQDEEVVSTVDVKDDYVTTDIGAIIGLQAKAGLFVLDFRYNHGITDIIKDNEFGAVLLRTAYATIGFTF